MHRFCVSTVPVSVMCLILVFLRTWNERIPHKLSVLKEAFKSFRTLVLILKQGFATQPGGSSLGFQTWDLPASALQDWLTSLLQHLSMAGLYRFRGRLSHGPRGAVRWAAQSLGPVSERDGVILTGYPVISERLQFEAWHHLRVGSDRFCPPCHPLLIMSGVCIGHNIQFCLAAPLPSGLR